MHARGQLPRDPRGQVLVIIALAVTVLLAFAGLAIDVGRAMAERRHVQNAADAGALAACAAIIDGALTASAAASARTVAEVNLQRSPAGATATIAPDDAPEYADGHAGDPEHLVSGVLITSSAVRVAIESTLPALLGPVVGIHQLETGARARCAYLGGPAIPIVVRRYTSPPGPGGGFVDHLASLSSSASGQVDPGNVYGYDGRTPASEAEPGPVFELYGPNSKAINDSSFRGFVALDIRNFQSTTSRIYYNGVMAGTNPNTIKEMQGAYITDGYPGPNFPPVTMPADPNDQVAIMTGNDTAMVLGNFETRYQVGDRVLLAAYNGTVMEIPDFAVTPPSAISLPSTTSSPTAGPSFAVSRNDEFSSTVTLHLHGDHAGSDPAHDILPVDGTAPPAAGKMNEPLFDPQTFLPAKNGTRVDMGQITTNAVPAGIYTVWLEGHSGDPYFQTRRQPVPVKIDGASRDFSLVNSTVTGSTDTPGATISLPIYVSTTTASSTRWDTTNPVSLSADSGSFTDCSLSPEAIGAGQITLSPTSVVPSSSGSGALSTLSIDTAGLAPGCYRFVLRATGTNGDGQPVVHLQPITFTVATVAGDGQYVDIIGFAVLNVTDVTANSISGEAVSGIFADPNDPALRRAQRARLVMW
jgi:Tfp pilus assembly protein PilX